MKILCGKRKRRGSRQVRSVESFLVPLLSLLIEGEKVRRALFLLYNVTNLVKTSHGTTQYCFVFHSPTSHLFIPSFSEVDSVGIIGLNLIFYTIIQLGCALLNKRSVGSE